MKKVKIQIKSNVKAGKTTYSGPVMLYGIMPMGGNTTPFEPVVKG
jgi:hypothetical protein